MKKIVVALLVLGTLLPLLAAPADAWGGHGGWHGQRCCWHGGGFGSGFFFGFATGTVLSAPFWYPPAYAYPAYTYPAYSYPAYSYYPTYSYPAYSAPAAPSYPMSSSTAITYPAAGAPPAPPASVTTPTPEPLSPPSSSTETGQAPATSPGGAQAASRNCQMVLVEGHYETRVSQSGQRATSWIPAFYQQVCQ